MPQLQQIDGLDIKETDAPRTLSLQTGAGTPQKVVLGQRGEISAVSEVAGVPEDWRGDFTTPGLVDIQVNGFAGIDFNAPGLNGAQLDHALAHMAASGVTRVLPTLITASVPKLLDLLRALDRAVSESVLGPFMVPGYHMEGPFLSPKEGSAGAHPASAMIAGSPDLVKKLMGVASRPIRIMTIAPEQEGVLELIPFLVDNSIVCAIGHTAASREQIGAAIAAGASVSTHLGNGLPHMLNKHDNPLFTQLGRDELTASFIADGIHIHPQTLQTCFRAKTLGRSIIVTDAVSAAGAHMHTGLYGLADTKIERKEDGTVRIPGSTYLAGSSATMDQMVRNLLEWYNFSMPEILRLARQNPLQILPGFSAQLKPGAPADFVRWHHQDGALRVEETLIGPYSISPQS